MPKPSRALPAPGDAKPPPPDSRAAILAAATEELAERGFDGMRMEHVAKRAGYNKALVYKHFKDRTQLFEAVLAAAFSGRRAVLERQPRWLGDAMAAWSDAAFAAPAYGKLLMREALEYREPEPVLAAERARYYREQVTGVAEAQARGRLPADLPANFLFLALMSMVCMPAFLPNVTALATGLDPNSEDFQQEWREFLRAFAAMLGAPTEAGKNDVDA